MPGAKKSSKPLRRAGTATPKTHGVRFAPPSSAWPLADMALDITRIRQLPPCHAHRHADEPSWPGLDHHRLPRYNDADESNGTTRGRSQVAPALIDMGSGPGCQYVR